MQAYYLNFFIKDKKTETKYHPPPVLLKFQAEKGL